MKNMVTKMRLIAKRILPLIPVMFMIFATGAAAEEENVSVRVNAPEFVSGTFDVTIDIYDVIDLTSGQFYLYFDPDVVTFLDVEPSGYIDGTELKVQGNVVGDEVIVISKVHDTGLVSGSGYLATIGFEVVGNDGDTSALEVSDGEDGGLFPYIKCDNKQHGYEDNTGLPGKINVDWFGDVVTVGNAGMVGAAATAETPVQTAAPRSSSSSLDSGAGSVTASTPATGHASDAAMPVGASERDEPDIWDVLAEHNFIEIYSFIGLLAFIYTLTLLR